MQTVGEILKEKRKEKSLTLVQVERAIKIKQKFLKFLERDSFEKFPSEIYARGFIKNYAEFLGLPSEKVLAIFRRQFRKKENSPPFKKLTRGESFFRITPEKIKVGFVLTLFLLFSGYLFWQYRLLTRGPSLTLTEPPRNFVAHKEEIRVRGRVEPDTRVFINSEEVYPDEKGEFSQRVLLSEGVNQIIIVAENKAGRRRMVKREVVFEPF